jgi:trehalose 6-phosphate synthase/phosphatase
MAGLSRSDRSFGAHLGAFTWASDPQASSAVHKRLFIRASIEVRCETVFGDCVAVCGSTEQLGCWRPERALRMQTDEGMYPIWRCEPLLMCADDGLEFKFIILRGDAATTVVWEPLVHNRRLVLSDELVDVRVFAAWGVLEPAPAPITASLELLAPPDQVLPGYGGVGGAGSCGNYRAMLSPIAGSGGDSASTRSSIHGGSLHRGGSAASGSAHGSAHGGFSTNDSRDDSRARSSTEGEDVPPSPDPSSSPRVARHSKEPATATGGGGGGGAPGAPDGLVERLLVVMHHLPLLLHRSADGAWEIEWDEASLLATSSQGGRHLLGALHIEVIFVGMTKSHVPRECEDEVRALLQQHNCVPVFQPAQAEGGAPYHGFATQVLWPLLHNQIPDRPAGGRGADGKVVPSLWKAYVTINELFAAEVRRTLRQGDMVWVHNYHLLLVPAKIREGSGKAAGPAGIDRSIPANCIISLFLHTPYPSPEIWRVMPYRTQLLQGMLAANVVGFHLFEYARHFMTSCRRLLGLGEKVGAGPAGGVLSISLQGRQVTLTVSHVGIDRDVMLHRLRQSGVEQQVQAMRDAYGLAPPGTKGARKVIGGLEMLNVLQGAHLKLLAYEELLRSYPMWRARLCLVQVCMPDPARPDDSSRLSEEMRATAKRIHDAYGHETLHYLEVGTELKSWGVNDRLALMRLTDVYLNCAMRDGLNLLPFEFVLTKSSQEPPSDGIAILSEFVGCSHVLNGAMRINPFNLEHVVEQIDLALAMSPAERAARLAKDYTFVRSTSTATWLKVAVQDMRRVRSAMLTEKTPAVLRPTTGLSAWHSGSRPGDVLPRMMPEQVCRAYRASTRRVIILGLDGTLIQQDQVISYLKNFHDFQGHTLQPPAAALHCLAALASDPANVVYVISGRSASDMQATLGRVPGLGLAAELGYVQLPPRASRGGGSRTAPLQSAPMVRGATRSARAAAARSAPRPSSDSCDSGYENEGEPFDDGGGGGGQGGAAAKAAKAAEAHAAEAAALAVASSLGEMTMLSDGWTTLLHELPPAHPNWRELALSKMREFTTRTNGSYDRSQRSAVQWCYHDSDPDYGLMQARSLTRELESVLRSSGVTVNHSHSKGLVEVRLAGVNKGAAADHILTEADATAPVDFLLCIGDDDDDEFMLSATTARACAPGLRERLQTRLFTVSVGTRASSHAQYVASDASQVLALLEFLREDAH